MKKLGLLLMVCLLVVVTGTAFAANDLGVAKPIDLTAIVGQYASVSIGTPEELSFDGSADQTKEGSVVASIESNCPVTAAIAVTTPFTLVGGSNTFTTACSFDVFGNPVDVDTDLTGDVNDADVTIHYWGTTGAISSQAAGTYSAQLSLTVSAI